MLWRALRWRRGSSIALLVVAAFAVAGSAIGPLFLSAADDSVLTSIISNAAPGSATVTLISSGGRSADSALRAAAATASRQGNTRFLAPPVESADAGVQFSAPGGTFTASLYAKSGSCRRLTFVAGSCPRKVGDVALSSRSAKAGATAVGRALVVGAPGAKPGRKVERLRIVGIYRLPATVANDYWEDRNEFDFGPPPHPGQPPQLDPLIASPATVLSSIALGVQPQFIADLNLRPGTLRSGQVGSLDSSLSTFRTNLARHGSVTVSTGLFGLFAESRHDAKQMDAVVAAIVVQLVLLSLLVVYSLVSIGSRDRWLEAEIANRRGFTRWSMLRVAVGEPIAILLVALPIGFALAWAASAVAASRLLVAGTPVGPTGLSLLAAVGGFVGGVAAAVVASWDLWHGATRPGQTAARRGSFVAAADAAAIALGTAGLIALSVGGSLSGTRPDPVAALAPALLALAAGVLAVRLLALAIRGLMNPTEDSRFLATFLALRELSRRRPSALRRLLPLIAAIAVAVFAVAAWTVAAENRKTVALFDTGASRVVTVTTRPGVNLEAAVRAADPSGKQAMAVEIHRSQGGELLAVDPTRLVAVGAWPKSLTRASESSVAQYLAPSERQPIQLTGDGLRARATLAPGSPRVALSATVFSLATQDQATITMGVLRPGTGTYRATLGGFCATTCRLASLNVSASHLGRHPRRLIDLTVTPARGDERREWGAFARCSGWSSCLVGRRT